MVIRDWIDAINKRDLERLTQYMSSDHIFYVEGETPTIGVAANKTAWQGYFSAFPNYTIYIDSTYEHQGNFYLLGHTSGSHVPSELESVPESVIWKASLDADSLAGWIIYDGTTRHELGIPNDA